MMTSDKKRILVIGADWEQYSLVETIKKQGYNIIATHPSMNTNGFKIADHYYVKNSRDINAHINIAKTHEVDAVVTDNCDYSFYTASIVAEKLNLPFNNIDAGILSNNKFKQRTRCEGQGILQPHFHLVQSLDELKDAVHKLGFPVIVKPIDSRGTFGITIIKKEHQIEDAFIDAISHSPSRQIICEDFITGTLITVDGFCFKNGHHSLAVASRKFEKGIKPVTKEIIYPAELPAKMQKNLFKNHDKVVKILGYNQGHTHGEYIFTDQQEIYFLECANRGGGVYTSSVILPHLTGIDVNEVLINQSLGIDDYIIVDRDLEFMKRAMMLTFLDFKVDKVIKSFNIYELQSLPYVIRFRSIFGINDMVETVENCASRHSMLVLDGKNIDDLKSNFQDFKSKLQIEYYDL